MTIAIDYDHLIYLLNFIEFQLKFFFHCRDSRCTCTIILTHASLAEKATEGGRQLRKKVKLISPSDDESGAAPPSAHIKRSQSHDLNNLVWGCVYTLYTQCVLTVHLFIGKTNEKKRKQNENKTKSACNKLIGSNADRS